MHLLITIDTEVYPLSPRWHNARELSEDIARDIDGVTRYGEFGLMRQLQVLRESELKAVFFVEGLFASVPEVGLDPLKRICDQVLSNGHEVQLHLHPEWMPYIPRFEASFGRHLLHSYSYDVQYSLISEALSNLQRAGAHHVVAFRAGDFAADLTTLRVLSELGIHYDASYNACYLPDTCKLGALGELLAPTRWGSIIEVPVTTFVDRPNHLRPFQSCACSAREIEALIAAARVAQYPIVTMVSHTFEDIRDRRHPRRAPSPKPYASKRLQAMGRMLTRPENRDVRSLGFSGLEPITASSPLVPLSGSIFRTAARLVEQLRDRIPV